jgi:signal transduction histidine kinase
VEPSALLVATTHELPLHGDVAQAHTTVGTSTWTLAAAARSPLTGGFANLAPFIILLLGIVLALSVGTVVEVLDRRQRYAAVMVAERTGELERSLAELRDAQRALVRAERLTAVGEMASVVGHELRNPLAAVTNALYLLRHALGDRAAAPLEKQLAMAERETAKAATLAEDLIAFVRPRQPRKEAVQLQDVVHEVMETTPPPAGIRLDVEVDPLLLEVDRGQLAEVLTNLVTNAYQAMGDSGSVRIVGHMNGSGAQLCVEDDGPGIDGALSDRVFEPFFTTKSDGTGLGLAIVRRLVEAHDGDVTLENRTEGRGARVVLRIPVGSKEGGR